MGMTKKFHLIFALISAMGSGFGAGPALAGSDGMEVKGAPTAVLELFTSQGCSSCPPADKLLEELSMRSDLITLAYHVDYWDYIGWKDTFGSPKNTKLQRDYAEGMGSRRIYTPQVVINGKVHVVGSRRDEIEAAVSADILQVPVEMGVRDGVLEVDVEPQADGTDSAVLWLVTFRKQADVVIERGENRDQTLSYSHVVLARQAIGVWDPAEGVVLRLPLADVMVGDADGLAILVQTDLDGLPGPVLGAAALAL
jgi:hypothetical protein